MAREVVDRLLGPPAVSEWLDMSEETLAKWRYLGRGPRWFKVGKHVRYRRQDVERWLEEQADPRPAA